MGQPRRVAVMISLDWPVKHHYQVLAGIQRYAREGANWEYFIDPHADLTLRGQGPEAIPDGIVGRITALTAELASKAGVPVVNTWLNSPAKGVPTVTHDPEEAGRMAARHLLERGFRKFGFLGFVGDLNTKLQLEGFRSALRQRDYACSTCWVPAQYEHSDKRWLRFRAKLGRWIDRWTLPIGVFTTHDVVCRYLADLCFQRRLKVPGNVSLVSSFNELILSAFSRPALSSVDFGFEEVGHRASTLLDALMDGAAPPAGPIRVTPASLMVRESSSVFAVTDPVVTKALRFIVEHLHEQIGVEEVAAHVAIGRQTLFRQFRRALHQSIYETITRLRLERAKQLLIEPGALVKTVAAKCGFRDAVHLYKVFEHAEGISPSEYRVKRTAWSLE